ncbi:hypothetical protein, conserved [Babesia ovata]|uniref:C3H1-type domain-containing protein n=1 Tax=Babesia ovata TaxID=189622 RepID=A0A2H6KJG0_9APIC|nr:uncharacterized protein BOVATA_046250 [Babesia ovata]GBE63132.1 hypothetical protein, conserved [Babesia ovata]
MSFLHGVLESVKEDDSVTTYNKYIKLNSQDDLHTVLQHLQSSIGQGRSVFGAKIQEVSGWLKKYWTQVNSLSHNVAGELDALGYMLSGKYIGEIHETQGLEEQLTAWRTTVSTISDAVERIKNDHISHLDSALRNQMNNNIKPIEKVVDHIKIVSHNAALFQQATQVDNELTVHKGHLLNTINTQSSALERTLEKEYKNILTKIKDTTVSRNKQFRNVRNAIQTAHRFLDEQYDNQYKYKLSRHFNALQMEVNNIHNALLANKVHLTGLVSEMQKTLKELSESFGSSVKTAVKLDLGALHSAITELDSKVSKDPADGNIVSEQLKSLKLQKDTLDKITASGNSDATNLEKKFETAIKERLSGLVGGVDSAIKALCGRFQLEDKKNNLAGILEHIKGEVGKIYEGNGDKKDKGLRGVEKAFRTYAKTFKDDDGLAAVVQKWIKDILDTNEVVRKYIAEYLRRNKNNSGYFKNGYVNETKFVMESTNTNDVASAIKEQLSQQIQTAQKEISSLNGDIVENIEKLKQGCEKFATELNDKIEKDKQFEQISRISFVYGIVTAIDDAVRENGHTADNTTFLFEAVRAILAALISAARRTAGELNSILLDKKVGANPSTIAAEIDGAKSATMTLLEKVTAAATASCILTDPTCNVDSAIGKVSDQIKKIEKIFKNEVKEHLHQAVERFNSDAINQITGAATTAIDNAGQKVIAEIKKFTVGSNAEGTKNLAAALQKLKLEFDKLNTYIKSGGTSGEIDKMLVAIQQQLTEHNEISKDDADGEINKKKKEAENLMDKLKYEIKYILQVIESNVTDTDDLLKEAISAVYMAVYTANNKLKQTIQNVKDELIRIAKNAFDSIIKEVKSLFSASHAADLQALRALVETQLREVQTVIARDAVTGVKGMLKTLSGVSIHAKNIDFTNENNLLNKLKKDLPQSPPQGPPVKPTKEHFKNLAFNFQDYIDPLLQYTEGQVKDNSQDKNNPLLTQQSLQVKGIQNAVDDLLKHLSHHEERRIDKDTSVKRIYIFDDLFTTLLKQLSSSISALSPSHFHGFHNPLLLDALKSGMTKFTEQLSHAYVNKYSGQKPKDRWAFDGYQVDTRESKRINEFTEEGRKAARVFLTISRMIYENLFKLRDECEGRWSDKYICETDSKGDNPLGSFLKGCGFRVAENEASKKGELRFPYTQFKGEGIKDLLPYTPASTSVIQLLETLVPYLNQYNQIGHNKHIPSPRVPCSIYEMLAWCCGLQFNSVYELLVKYCDEYDTNDTDKAADTDFKNRLSDAVDHGLPILCKYSHNLLITILGTGDEDTLYGVELSNNSLNLKYPTSGADCLHTLLDILRKLLPTLRFLKSKCKLSTQHGGWEQCEYGKDIAPANWPCKDHSTKESNCQPMCRPNGEPTCQPKSPLMSYLNDTLPGHLPHDVSAIGCRATCNTCPKSKPGQPCLTPLGFRGFSGSTRTGKELCEALGRFFSSANLSPLFCIAPNHHPRYQSTSHLRLHDLTKAIIDAYGSASADHTDCTHHHLTHLTSFGVCSRKTKNIECVPYVSPLCRYSYHDLVNKHANLYLSWSIYLPWAFWECLKNLYDEFCDIFCQDWGCRSCLRGNKCKRGKHGVVEDDKKDVTCQCKSMVQCKGVSPTLYKCGLSFGEAWKLNAESRPRTCSDFCSQLKNVLHSDYFTKLFGKCDEFLWIIREPFSYLLLALWSLSLLYLLHITVVRLDVLRIRSHLRSPQATASPPSRCSPPQESRHSPTSSTSHHNRAFTCDLCITHQLTHPPTHSLTQPPNHSTTQPPTHSLLTQPLTHSTTFTQPLNHSPNHPPTQPLTHSTTHPLNHSTAVRPLTIATPNLSLVAVASGPFLHSIIVGHSPNPRFPPHS